MIRPPSATSAAANIRGLGAFGQEPSSRNFCRAARTAIFLRVNRLEESDHLSSTSAPRERLRAVVALLVIVALGGWLRGSQVGESLWLDELHTSWVVADGWGSIVPRAQAGNQGPLYFYLVRGCVECGGHHEWTLRLVSLVAGTGLIAAVYGLVRRWRGSVSTALLAALLVALQRDCIFYAQEARPYALLQLIALWHGALVVELWERPSSLRRAAYVLGAAVLFYLHYTSALFLLAESVAFAVWRCTQHNATGYRWRMWAVDCLLIGLLLLPAMQHLQQIAAVRQNWARMVSVWPGTGMQYLGLFYIGLPLLALGAGRIFRWRTGVAWRPAVWMWVGCWCVVPPLVAWFSTWLGLAALGIVRYLVASIAGLIVFAVWVQSRYVSRLYRSCAAITLIICTLAVGGLVEQWSLDGRWIGDRQEPWSELVTWLNQRTDSVPRPVYVCAGLLEDAALVENDSAALRDYCLFPVRGIYRVAAERVDPLPTRRDVRVPAALRELAMQQGGVWLIVRSRPERAAAMVATIAEQLAARETDTWQRGNLTVVRLDR